MNVNAKGALWNAIDLNGSNRIITSLHTNGDGAASTGFSVYGAITNSTGAAGLIKTGAGAVILNHTNTYNGATSIQDGSIILSSVNTPAPITAIVGTINNTTALNLSGGGTLRLVNTAQVNRFADAAAITVSAGGGISYQNTNTAAITYSETLGAVTLSGGNLDVVLNTNQSTSNGQTLTFGTAGSSNLTQSGTGTVAFSAATTGPQAATNKNMIVVFGSGTTSGWVSGATSNPVIGPYATTGVAAIPRRTPTIGPIGGNSPAMKSANSSPPLSSRTSCVAPFCRSQSSSTAGWIQPPRSSPPRGPCKLPSATRPCPSTPASAVVPANSRMPRSRA